MIWWLYGRRILWNLDMLHDPTGPMTQTIIVWLSQYKAKLRPSRLAQRLWKTLHQAGYPWGHIERYSALASRMAVERLEEAEEYFRESA